MSSRPLIVLLLTAGLAAGGCDRQSPKPEQAAASAATNEAVAETAPAPTADEMPSGAGAEKVVRETIGTLDRSHKGEVASTLPFKDADGKAVTLTSFKGKPVLLNLWATWCAPCVAEMPTLDKLATRLGDSVTILTVSQDLEGAAKVMPFFAKGNFENLKPWTDDQAGLSVAYQANLPTTILFDSSGHEVWRMAGGMDWTSATAGELIAEAR
ncbi:MAG: TlpA family protein disulfide reductase [Sphingomonas sp.]|nr:TlpA family protein disulfide reductase [Sphingomonas sp.]